METKHTGGCHCGAVKFEIDGDAREGAGRCNCSACTRIAITSKLVKPEAFRLVEGEASLSCYEWGAKVSQRFFCKRCGVHCFARGYLEEVGGAYVSVNLNCVDGIDPEALAISYWDGRHDNWEAG